VTINATVGALGEQRGHKTLRVVSKGNRERLVKVPPEVAWQVERWREAARALREERPQTPLFCGLVKVGRGKDAVYLSDIQPATPCRMAKIRPEFCDLPLWCRERIVVPWNAPLMVHSRPHLSDTSSPEAVVL